jgi:hypothetical protein
MGSLGLTCDQVKMNFPVGLCSAMLTVCYGNASSPANSKNSASLPLGGLGGALNVNQYMFAKNVSVFALCLLK